MAIDRVTLLVKLSRSKRITERNSAPAFILPFCSPVPLSMYFFRYSSGISLALAMGQTAARGSGEYAGR